MFMSVMVSIYYKVYREVLFHQNPNEVQFGMADLKYFSNYH